jgi:hypothetical protein
MTWDKIRGAWRSRTVRFGIFTALLGVIEGSLGTLRAAIPEAAYPWIVVAMSVVMIVMRWITTLPLDKR